MTPTPDLLAECSAHGIHLAPDAGGGLTIDAPPEALTPERLARLKAHKAELLTALRTSPEDAGACDPIYLSADRWLWRIASAYVCGSARDPETGKLWHVREAVSRLILADWSEPWLCSVRSLHRALTAERESVPLIGERDLTTIGESGMALLDCRRQGLSNTGKTNRTVDSGK